MSAHGDHGRWPHSARRRAGGADQQTRRSALETHGRNGGRCAIARTVADRFDADVRRQNGNTGRRQRTPGRNGRRGTQPRGRVLRDARGERHQCGDRLMFAEIFRFECRQQLSSPLFIAVSLVFFLFGFLAMASENVTVGGGTANLNLNAPFTILQTHYVLSVIGMFATAAFIAAPLTRDRELKTEETLLSTGVRRLPFLFGRL